MPTTMPMPNEARARNGSMLMELLVGTPEW
jgi:hypothetical protein